MITPLLDKVRNSKSGYILLDTNGNLSHKSIAGGRLVDLEGLLSTIGVVLFPRTLLPYQGVLFWYRSDNELVLHGMKTKEGTNLLALNRLYNEFERLARETSMTSITTSTHIPEKVMRRLGFKPLEEVRGSDFLTMYKKELTTVLS